MRRRARWFVGLAFAAVALPACGAGTPVTRGFDSHQVLQIRDSTFFFNGGFGATSIGYSTEGDGGFTLFTVDLTTGEAQPVGPPDAGTGETGTGYDCAIEIDQTTNTETILITDLSTGQQTSIANVSDFIDCPHGSSTTLTILRSDPSGTLALWSGPFDNLQEVPLSIDIAQPVFAGGLVVLGAYPAQPSALGLFSIDLTTFVATELVPPTLGTAAWANGAAGTGSLVSSSLLEGSKSFQGPMSLFDGSYVYERTMDDGSATLFAGPFSSGPAELALFQPAASATLSIFNGLPGRARPLPMAIWLYEDDPAQTMSLLVWNGGLQQFLACPLASSIAPIGVTTADGSKILFGSNLANEATDPGGSSSPLILASFPPVGSGTCTVLAPAKVEYADFSSDGSRVFWLVQPDTGDATLWTAASDGTGARTIGSGVISQPRFAVGTELEFELGGDLVWVDANDSSNTLHYVAEQVFGTAIDLEGPWVVTGYDRSTTDATGLLGLVNRDTGGKRLISPEVSAYESQYQAGTYGGNSLGTALPDGGVPATRIAYLVHGRNPSPQDGIWVATITESDLH